MDNPDKNQLCIMLSDFECKQNKQPWEHQHFNLIFLEKIGLWRLLSNKFNIRVGPIP